MGEREDVEMLDKKLSELKPKEIIDIGTALKVASMLQWKGFDNFLSILSYDKTTDTILIDKEGLLKSIQLLCPQQQDRNIRLI